MISFCDMPSISDWEKYLCDNFATKEIDNRISDFTDSIDKMAKEFVCPITKEPKDEKEEELIQTLVMFGHLCVVSLLSELMQIQEKMIEEAMSDED